MAMALHNPQICHAIKKKPTIDRNSTYTIITSLNLVLIATMRFSTRVPEMEPHQ